MLNSNSKKYILPIYKNKILLLAKESYDPNNKESRWMFLDESMIKGSGISKVEMTEIDSGTYYARMTDKNVNELVRKDGLLLEFYTYKEVTTLSLSKECSVNLEKNGETIRAILGNS